MATRGRLDDRSKYNIMLVQLQAGQRVDTTQFVKLAKKLGERPDVSLRRVYLDGTRPTEVMDWNTYSWTKEEGEEEKA